MESCRVPAADESSERAECCFNNERCGHRSGRLPHLLWRSRARYVLQVEADDEALLLRRAVAVPRARGGIGWWRYLCTLIAIPAHLRSLRNSLVVQIASVGAVSQLTA